MSTNIENITDQRYNRVKLFAIANLGWDYIDSIFRQCAILKLSPVKHLSRKIREVKKAYDHCCTTYRINYGIHHLYQYAVNFEDAAYEVYKDLMKEVDAQVKPCQLVQDHHILVLAVVKSVVTLKATYRYASECLIQSDNKDISSDELYMVKKLAECLLMVIKEYAGNCYPSDIESLEDSAAKALHEKLIDLSMDELTVIDE